MRRKQSEAYKIAVAWAVFVGTFILVCLVGMYFFVGLVLHKMDVKQCYKWQSYESKYSSFDLNNVDKDRCKELGVII